MKVTITLNGGPENVWHIYGLKCNPFPQIPRAEFAGVNRILRELDSDPLPSTEDVRRILKGCDPEFIDGCCQRFRPGKRVSFDVTWPD